MKINNCVSQNINFKSLYTNKLCLSGLEKIANHSASFVLATSFIGAAVIRPLAISLTPKAKKENKKIIQANSVSSGIIKLLMAEVVALPLENAINNISKNPKNFLNNDTFNNFFKNKNDYNFLTQTIKQSANILTAIPKSFLTVALIPVLMDKFINKKKNKENKENKENINTKIFEKTPNFSSFNNLSFSGKINDFLSKQVSKLINSENLQQFAKKHSANSENLTRNMSVFTDILLVGASIFQIKKSKKINEERKKPLIANNMLSTLFSIVFGFGVDKIVKSATKQSVEKFKELNKNNLKLSKYIEGINVLRPTLIFAVIYYALLPLLTTYLSDKFDNKNQDHNNEINSLKQS